MRYYRRRTNRNRLTKIISITIPKEFDEPLRTMADRQGRNISNMVSWLIQRELKAQKLLHSIEP